MIRKKLILCYFLLCGCPPITVEQVPNAQWCEWVQAASPDDPADFEPHDQMYLYCSDESINECDLATNVAVVSYHAFIDEFKSRGCFDGPGEYPAGDHGTDIPVFQFADCVGVDTGQVWGVSCYLPVGWDDPG